MALPMGYSLQKCAASYMYFELFINTALRQRSTKLVVSSKICGLHSVNLLRFHFGYAQMPRTQRRHVMDAVVLFLPNISYSAK